jgi:hypothetical protein
MSDQLVSAQNKVERVKYYTARVSAKIDAQAPSKQQVYLSALATVPEIEINYGRFLFGEKWAFLIQPPPQNRPIMRGIFRHLEWCRSPRSKRRVAM